jgi:hypothetical protein
MAREDLDVPDKVRTLVVTRDASCCRICGRFVEHPALHHIMFGGDARGMGGRRRHDPDEMVVLGSYGAHDCHTNLAHRYKARFQPLLLEVVTMSGVTALALERWRAAR